MMREAEMWSGDSSNADHHIYKDGRLVTRDAETILMKYRERV